MIPPFSNPTSITVEEPPVVENVIFPYSYPSFISVNVVPEEKVIPPFSYPVSILIGNPPPLGSIIPPWSDPKSIQVIGLSTPYFRIFYWDGNTSEELFAYEYDGDNYVRLFLREPRPVPIGFGTTPFGLTPFGV